MREDAAHAARCAVDECRHARGEPADFVHEVVRGHAAHEQWRGHRVRDAVGNRHQPIGRNEPPVTVGTRGTGVAGPHAGFEVGHAAPDGLHDAYAFAADDRGQVLHDAGTSPVVDIDEIHAERVLPQQHFARAGCGGDGFAETKVIGITKLVEKYGTIHVWNPGERL